MNSLRIRLLAVLAGIVIMGSGYFLIYEEEKTDWTISGGETGGHYDEAAKAIADVLRNSNGWKVEVSGSSGSGDNLIRLAKGEVDLCPCAKRFFATRRKRQSGNRSLRRGSARNH